MAALLLDEEIPSTTASSPTSTSSPEGYERRRNIRHRGSIISLLRTLTNSESPAWSPLSASSSRQSSGRRGIFKKISLPFIKGQLGGGVTVIHRMKRKPRPSVHSIERAADQKLPASAPALLSASTSNSNTNSSGKSSGPINGTGTTMATSLATSFDSKLSIKDNDPVDQRSASIVHHKEPDLISMMTDLSLTTIEEKGTDPPAPTVLTIERAAAAKIYLETYFNEKLNKPSPRSLRRRYLENELYHCYGVGPAERDMRRALFRQRETNHLRETRVLLARSLGAMKRGHNELADDYEVLKILGKGSFGVVRLVRKKPERGAYWQNTQVYAMKVIRKSAMLKTSQEGHLRAERDFLVASEGSRWIVPLVASFQDAGNLYLVMDYMPGGDFLGLLIRENILSEPVAKFYIAEMILCIEEAHALRCIHRDIKPDNFLISATGHLKISDFGLAFDGHWSHDTSYYHTQRYSLLQKLGLSVEGDAADRAEGLQGRMKWAQGVTQAMRKHERQGPLATGTAAAIMAATPPATPSSYASPSPSRSPLPSPGLHEEPLLNWRNRCGNRSAARSCVGTSQYMAPEVIREGEYDARCDWWSLGVILYECLYGHTPFLAEEGGRQQTKRNIVNHEQTFAFPPRPVVSRRCMDLVASLVCGRESRLSSKRYLHHHYHRPPAEYGIANARARSPRDTNSHAVYPHDAEDIKAHKWFRDIPWEQLHLVTPPFVPQIIAVDDTHYFNEEEPISDWSDSHSSSDADDDEDDDNENNRASEVEKSPLPLEPNPLTANATAQTAALSPFDNAHPTMAIQRSPQKTAAMQTQLTGFPRHVRGALAQFVAAPYDSARLKRIEREIKGLAATSVAGSSASTSMVMPSIAIACASPPPPAVARFHEMMLADQMKTFVRTFGRRERKRPRDRLLRDRNTKATVLEVRKQTAFLGYTFRRAADVDIYGPAVPRYDGADMLWHGGMPCVAKYDGFGPGNQALGMEMGMGMGMVGVGAEGMQIRPCESVHLAGYTPMHHGQKHMGMGW
ncbi:kinase-like protein [Nemania sp. FL0916]|nr:kinase-like protein [Nemania sp. FL0916]